MRKDDTSSKVYLGVADRQIEQIVSQADFERNLMVNLLFQKEIIVPDIFWFISRRIQSHVNRRVSPSLLEEALAQGVVLPYFRQTSCSSFVDAYREIKREGILGVLPTAGQLAERLEKTIENNSKYRFGDWGGQNMAINYEKTVKEYLQRAEPANLNYLEDRKRRELLQLWNRTKEWRYELIEEAINRTEGGGLRRGEIMSALGRRVKYPYEQVHDVRYLYGLLGDNVGQAKALMAFTRWITECYHYNQASLWGLFSGFAPSKREEAVIPYSALQPEGASDVLQEIDVASWKVKFPSFPALSRVNPACLVRFREQNHNAQEYFKALNNWLSNPDRRTKGDLEEKLIQYAEVLGEFVPGSGYSTIDLVVTVSSKALPASTIINAAFLAIKYGASLVTDATPLSRIFDLITVANAGFIVFNWIKSTSESRQITIRRHVIQNPSAPTEKLTRASIDLRPAVG